ncbi:hypothetical protein [Desulfosporosinus youngiae]|uniref:hypothetical protein n=1 Tax=Desulfosporosinus youngiae TaxID=339862 RepID=UPI0005A9689D|nr:hypothetical protein [Desulfosporosinus youngiae]
MKPLLWNYRWTGFRVAAHAAVAAPAEDENGVAPGGQAASSTSAHRSTPRLAHSQVRELPSADKYSLEIAASAKLSTGHFRAKPQGNT